MAATTLRRSGYVKLVLVMAAAVGIGVGGAYYNYHKRFSEIKEGFTVFCQHDNLSESQVKITRDKDQIDLKDSRKIQEEEIKTSKLPVPIPFRLSIADARAGEDTAFSFRIFSPAKGMKIEKIETKGLSKKLAIDYQWKELSADEVAEQGRFVCGYRVIGTLKKGGTPGSHRMDAVVKTNQGPEIFVDLIFNVAPAFSIKPLAGNVNFRPKANVVGLGMIEATRESSGTIGIVFKISDPNLEIKLAQPAAVPDGFLKVEIIDIAKNPGGSFLKLKLTVPKDCPPISLQGPGTADMAKIRLTTNNVAAKEIEFFVSFSKRGKQ